MTQFIQSSAATVRRIATVIAGIVVTFRSSELTAQNGVPPIPDAPPADVALRRITEEPFTLSIPGPVPVPAPGQANLVAECAGIAEPFCEVEAARAIAEEHSSSSPRCTPSPEAPAATGHQNTAVDPSLSLPALNQRTAVFAGPAHFSMEEFTSGHISIQKHPVMIYEGMSITVFEDGRYEVRAMLDAPRIPAILRLQLTFTNSSGQTTTVTLPPIALKLGSEDRSSTDLANQTQTWFVRRSGYSFMLRHPAFCSDDVQVRRTGTVQVGQIPAL